MNQPYKGRVRKWKVSFGFIESKSFPDEDIFIHWSDIVDDTSNSHRRFYEGDEVKFDTAPNGDKGTKAINAERLR